MFENHSKRLMYTLFPFDEKKIVKLKSLKFKLQNSFHLDEFYLLVFWGKSPWKFVYIQANQRRTSFILVIFFFKREL